MEKLKKYINNADKESLLYYISFFLIAAGAFMRTTMFGISPLILDVMEFGGFLVMFIKIVKYQRENTKLFLALLGIIGIAALVGSVSSDYRMMLSLAMITAGSVNVPFKKIAEEYFFIAVILLAVTVICSLTGVIENLQYVAEDRGVRNSFGIVYTTDFAAHVLFIMIAFAIAYEEKLNAFHSVLGIAAAVVVYIFCKTRVDCICMVLVCIGIPAVKILEKRNVPSLPKKICAQICTWSMPIAAAVMIFISAVYTPSSSLLTKLDRIISGRLALGREGFERYPVTLFGQYVKLAGWGGSTEPKSDYFFLDCSYIYCLMKFGIIMTLLIIAAYVFIGMRYRHSGLMLWIIAVTALNCMIAHHLPDAAYVFFTAAVFAEINSPQHNREGEGFQSIKSTDE